MEDPVYKTDEPEFFTFLHFTSQHRVCSPDQREAAFGPEAKSMEFKLSLGHLVISSVPLGNFLDFTPSLNGPTELLPGSEVLSQSVVQVLDVSNQELSKKPKYSRKEKFYEKLHFRK